MRARCGAQRSATSIQVRVKSIRKPAAGGSMPYASPDIRHTQACPAAWPWAAASAAASRTPHTPSTTCTAEHAACVAVRGAATRACEQLLSRFCRGWRRWFCPARLPRGALGLLTGTHDCLQCLRFSPSLEHVTGRDLSACTCRRKVRVGNQVAATVGVWAALVSHAQRNRMSQGKPHKNDSERACPLHGDLSWPRRNMQRSTPNFFAMTKSSRGRGYD